MIGLVLAETTVAHRIERLVLPLRDAFAAVFFFAFGLTIDPSDAGDVIAPVLVAVVLSLVLNVAAGLIAARMQGYGRGPAANIGLTVLGRGEFSLILATLARREAGFSTPIGPFVGFYVLILALVAPVLASRSGALSRLLPERLFARRGAAEAT
jgi:CPA2 family monovalent cation:H+ antiporter-2